MGALLPYSNAWNNRGENCITDTQEGFLNSYEIKYFFSFNVSLIRVFPINASVAVWQHRSQSIMKIGICNFFTFGTLVTHNLHIQYITKFSS